MPETVWNRLRVSVLRHRRLTSRMRHGIYCSLRLRCVYGTAQNEPDHSHQSVSERFGRVRQCSMLNVCAEDGRNTLFVAHPIYYCNCACRKRKRAKKKPNYISLHRNGNISRHGFPILCLLNMNCDIDLARQRRHNSHQCRRCASLMYDCFAISVDGFQCEILCTCTCWGPTTRHSTYIAPHKFQTQSQNIQNDRRNQ